MFKDDNGEPAGGMFSYISVVGMLLYLYGSTCPYVSPYVNLCSRYMFSPKRSHNLVLKILAHYLNQTKDRGLVLDTNSYVCKADAYPYAKVYGIYGHDKRPDPACVNIRTRFIIKFTNYPIFWVSKL